MRFPYLGPPSGSGTEGWAWGMGATSSPPPGPTLSPTESKYLRGAEGPWLLTSGEEMGSLGQGSGRLS